jgi:type II secretory pathway component GspD/PulD (secretin)
MRWHKLNTVGGCVVAVAAFVVGQPAIGPTARADNSDQGPRFKIENASTTQMEEEPTYDFEMRDQPWDMVFQRFSEITDQEVMGKAPKGTFTFVPHGKRQYTLDEITERINEALAKRDFTLIQSEKQATWHIVPAEKIDPSGLIPRMPPGLSPEELGKRRTYELATLKVSLTYILADDLANLEKQVGPIGWSRVVESSNCLLVTDTVGNLRKMAKTIKDIKAKNRREIEQKE